MKIHAEPIRAGDLKPGDLFSTADGSYWEWVTSRPPTGVVGERVYLRTTEAPDPDADTDAIVYRITIKRESDSQPSK